MEQDFADDDSSANNFEAATAMANKKAASNVKQMSLLDALNKVNKKAKHIGRRAFQPHSLKRPYPFEGHQLQKVKKVTPDGLQLNAFHKDGIADGEPKTFSKHPVSLLNEQCTNIIFKLQSVTGPSHCPLFTVTVTVDNITYTGQGKNKKEARSDAALNCLNAIKTRQDANQMLSVSKEDFTNDTDVKVVQASKDATGAGRQLGPSNSNPEAKTDTMQDLSGQASDEKTPLKKGKNFKMLSPALNGSAKVSKSPINVLYETYKTVSFNCATDEENGSPFINANQRFKMICSVEEEKFEGYGASKKTAKLAAARSALAVIRQRLSDGDPLAIKLATAMNGLAADVNGNPADGQDHSVLADKIGKLVIDKFTDLMRSDPTHGKRKVLAGVVMTDVTDPTNFKVIGVSSGTKCINGDRISAHGLVLNDCHAEVITRRCFMSYLYDQLRMYAEAPSPRDDIEESDLEPYVDGQWVGYRLRPTKKIHLYISTAPCGDSRIFSPHEENMDTDRHPNRLARGQLRTKLESGEGTIPVKNAEHSTQTWDGLVEGERLLTMSCSDKVARWNVLGLQGSLLSLFIQPIYLSSVVLGSLLHRPHLVRALYGRLMVSGSTWMEPLPPTPPFRVAIPQLERSSSTAEQRQPMRSPAHSVSWTVPRSNVEVVNAVTGMTETNKPPRLCKQSLFARWIYIARKLPIAVYHDRIPANRRIHLDVNTIDDLVYRSAKDLALPYEEAKVCLKAAFKRAGLGNWVKKPVEQDYFSCSYPNIPVEDIFV